jgi:hypothetical protein
MQKYSFTLLRMVHLQVADGGNGLQLWSVAVNKVNKQPQTNDKGWSSSWGFGRGTKTHNHKNKPITKQFRASNLDGFFG